MNKQKQAVLDMLYTRYTTKAYSETKVSKEDLQLMEKIFQMAPSSVNIQSWKLIIVEDTETKNKLAEAAWELNREKIKDCSHLLVFCTAVINDDFLTKIVKDTLIKKNLSLDAVAKQVERKKGFLKSFGNVTTWAEKQVYLNFGFFMAALGMLSIDSTAFEGIDVTQFDSVLQLENTGYYTTLALAVGCASEEDRNKPSMNPKARLDTDLIIEYK